VLGETSPKATPLTGSHRRCDGHPGRAARLLSATREVQRVEGRLRQYQKEAEAEAVSMRIIGPTFVAVAMGYREIGNAQIAPPHRYCSEQAGGVARPHHLS